MLFGEPRRLVPHLHAPLQSGSDRILKRMGRHWYTAGSYARAIERLVAGRDRFALGADAIAGFPGETDADHRATCELVAQLPFTYLHVFPFSERPGTAAERLSGKIEPNVIRARAAELRLLATDKHARYQAVRADQLADVVVVRGDVREGLTEDYLEVRMEGQPLPRGSRVDARLERRDGALAAIPVDT